MKRSCGVWWIIWVRLALHKLGLACADEVRAKTQGGGRVCGDLPGGSYRGLSPPPCTDLTRHWFPRGVCALSGTDCTQQEVASDLCPRLAVPGRPSPEACPIRRLPAPHPPPARCVLSTHSAFVSGRSGASCINTGTQLSTISPRGVLQARVAIRFPGLPSSPWGGDRCCRQVSTKLSLSR